MLTDSKLNLKIFSLVTEEFILGNFLQTAEIQSGTYQVLAHSQDGLDTICVGAKLCLEGLMLLVLGLNISRIFVGLFFCQLQLLQHPVLDLIGIAGELLQGLRLAQLGSLLNLGKKFN